MISRLLLFLFVAFSSPISAAVINSGWVPVSANSWRINGLAQNERGFTYTYVPHGGLNGPGSTVGPGPNGLVTYKTTPLTVVGEAVEVVGSQRLQTAAAIAGLAAFFAGPVLGPVLAIGSAAAQLAESMHVVRTPDGYALDSTKPPDSGSRTVQVGGMPAECTGTASACVSQMRQSCIDTVPWYNAVAATESCNQTWTIIGRTTFPGSGGMCEQVMVGTGGSMTSCDVPAIYCSSGSFPDGSCKGGPTTRLTSDLARQVIADAISGNKVASPVVDGAIQQALDAGTPFDLDIPSMSVQGPATVEGKPKTVETSSPGGTVDRVQSVDRATCSYSGNNVNCSVNTTVTSQTTIINSDGTVTTTPGPVTTRPVEPPQDPCLNATSRVGCMESGALPADSPVWSSREVVYSSDSLGLPSFCPAPQSWVLPHVSRPLTWSYQPACDVAPLIRSALLAITSVGCLLLIVRAVKT
jgi:hypothetical protein